jgi:hypothetical protein
MLVLMSALDGAPLNILFTMHLEERPLTVVRLSRLSGYPFRTTFKALLILMYYDLVTWIHPPRGSTLYHLKKRDPLKAAAGPGAVSSTGSPAALCE